MSIIDRGVGRQGAEQSDNKAWREAPDPQGSAGAAGRAAPETPPSGRDSRSVGERRVRVLEKIKAMDMVSSGLDRHPTIEEFRLIKRPVLAAASGRGASVLENGNLVMVTSSHPKEGKTFTACNLALTIAMEQNKTVLLVDTDITQASFTKLLNLQNEPGLVDYLVGEAGELSNVILQTDIPNLRVLPSGHGRQYTTELLSSESMQELVQDLSSRYHDRVIIFDTPPLLVSADAIVLAGLMGQVLLVVEAEKTDQATLSESLSLLDPSKAVGLILNKARRPQRPSYFSGHDLVRRE